MCNIVEQYITQYSMQHMEVDVEKQEHEQEEKEEQEQEGEEEQEQEQEEWTQLYPISPQLLLLSRYLLIIDEAW